MLVSYALLWDRGPRLPISSRCSHNSMPLQFGCLWRPPCPPSVSATPGWCQGMCGIAMITEDLHRFVCTSRTHPAVHVSMRRDLAPSATLRGPGCSLHAADEAGSARQPRRGSHALAPWHRSAHPPRAAPGGHRDRRRLSPTPANPRAPAALRRTRSRLHGASARRCPAPPAAAAGSRRRPLPRG